MAEQLPDNGDGCQPPPPLPSDADLMTEGCFIVLDQHRVDEKLAVLAVSLSKTTRVGSQHVSLAPLVGCPFGSCFELVDGNLVRTHVREESAQDLAADQRSNKQLIDDGTAQVMTEGDIHSLRAAGARGDEIVSALVASSTTFDTKTAFSQEKYKAKKKRIHCTRITAYRPTSARVCAAFFSKSPDRIAHMRFDALALALAACDAASGGCMLVCDGTGGLATASVMERLGGTGRVCAVHPSQQPPQLDIVRFFNFDEAHLRTLRRAPLTLLEAAFAHGTGDAPAALAAAEVAQAQAAAVGEPAPGGIVAMADGEQAPPPPGQPTVGGSVRGAKGHSSGRITGASRADALGYAATGGFGGLLCCHPGYDPTALLARLLPLLAGGSPFAVFANSAQPLAEAADSLLRQKCVVCMDLHEPWSRDHQVLPQRTHPMMNMSATGGFVLTGFTVFAPPLAAAWVG